MGLIDIEKVCSEIDRFEGYLDEDMIYRLKMEVKSIPTVDAEPVRHGHWEKPHRQGVVAYDEHAYAECSYCHKPQYLARGMNYCPHCGAKMDEEKENEGI